ncbi:DNA topoisomerase III [Thalassomonas sp. M1454]|uniref:DNA topoisomerase III n=1 Tax=Thalassomonas sp. M1454 TaxID=2594477 RepID=UPI00117DA80E|nr:DNA topoisomerase III [Thalassomonas sp. M1454]TRX53932.1 DNA topoisomerase III [Thalassomonas sp. M1454]
MKLYIAEKPSLGRAIADALPKPHKKQQGYIEVGNGDIVSWCIGHILEQAEPDAYDEKFKKWDMAHLPIVPDVWQLKPKSQTRSQLTVLRKLVKQCSQIIHAGDPDREGQLLVDEVIDYLKVSAAKKASMQRLLISDLNLPAVKRSLSALKPNSEFMPLSVSALARSRADWLYGLNLTRAYTIMGKKSGFNGVLSVGRVQTPILGLVVQRDNEINNFVSKPFYEVIAHIEDKDKQTFTAKWQPSEACQPYMDDEGRVLVKALAENVVKRINNKPAIVTELKQEQKKQFAPLPYNLSALQIDAAKRFSMNAKLVLDVCQSLYEKHKLITYPRSDCRYLPKEQLTQAKSVIDNLAKSSMPFSVFAKQANLSIKSKAWNDSKVSAHHAIIPTEKLVNQTNLNSFEQNIYQLIVTQYLAQFYPAFEYAQTKVSLNIENGVFKVNSKTPLIEGWKALFKRKSADNNVRDLSESQSLPQLNKGDVLHCNLGEVLEKNTQPPQDYTDASLLAAMTGIAKFVRDAQIKKVLKDTDGLGTEATRAGIIELLFKRGYLIRQGKKIKATEVGVSLINALPEQATLPDMTAHWESTLNAICDKQASYQSFMSPLLTTISQMIQQASELTLVNFPKLANKPKFKRKRKSSYKTKASAKPKKSA